MSTKEAAKPLQECVKETETIELYFQQGSSDKVYHLQLESVKDQWSVNAQWGRRGSALQSDTKVSSAAYEEAKRVYDRIVREKTGKGYRIAQATTNGDTPISVGLPAVTLPLSSKSTRRLSGRVSPKRSKGKHGKMPRKPWAMRSQSLRRNSLASEITDKEGCPSQDSPVVQ